MTNHTGPYTPGQARPTQATQVHAAHHLDAVPAALQAVALIDAPKCAAAGDMSVSWWHAEVAAGRAPQPVIRRPRCTRWHAAAVADFWRAFAAQADTSASEAMKVRATKASAAARAKRRRLAATPAQAGK